MTTNKPEIVAWFKPASDATLNSVDAVITDRSMKDRPEISTMGFTEPLVRLSDYEALQAECEKLRKDAERYRALRSMHWYDSPLAVVCNPKVAIKPGSDCPSVERLDAAIDAAMETTK